MKLYDWTEIEKIFKNGNLLLGNGASIAIDKRLSYRSLYEKVCDEDALNEDILNIFEYFDTSNFEFIMKMLLEANQVNEALNITENKTKEYYYELRDALINAIRGIHPTYDEVVCFLPDIANFLMKFERVMSLNYDLLVYWAMLVGNDQLECNWFKDCFVRGEFETDFGYLFKPCPPAKGVTTVFYPHGNLFLATDILGDEEKLARSQEDYLLETVLSKWQEKDYIPLFVSEGRTKEKLRAIERSNYLSIVYYSILAKLSGSLVIYGWSASDQDEHIFDIIDHKGIFNIAISVHTDNPKWESYCQRIENRINRTHNLRNSDLYFFDSHSEGCWIY